MISWHACTGGTRDRRVPGLGSTNLKLQVEDLSKTPCLKEKKNGGGTGLPRTDTQRYLLLPHTLDIVKSLYLCRIGTWMKGSPALDYDDIPFLQNPYIFSQNFTTLWGRAHKKCDSQDLGRDFFHRVDLNLGHHFGRKHCYN